MIFLELKSEATGRRESRGRYDKGQPASMFSRSTFVQPMPLPSVMKLRRDPTGHFSGEGLKT
ncbi:MAG: hypothetical protein ACMG6H_00255, partial [Acidobacteriota bacterium]